MSRISLDSAKYCHTVATLPTQVCETVDVLTNPIETEKNTALKTALIDGHALLLEKRLVKLYEMEDLGGQKPSEVLRQITCIAADSVNDGIIKKLWERTLQKIYRCLFWQLKKTTTKSRLKRLGGFV